MKYLPSLLCILVMIYRCYAPPVSPDKSKEQDSEIKDDLTDYMEYHRYLKEVVQALESDPEFRERLEKADEDDVRSGKIAEQLDFVNHNVRTQLDEIKRRELERLRHLATKQYELTNHIEPEVEKEQSNEHLDHQNPHTFEIEDLKKLIKKTTSVLDEANQKRKEEFKEYEMQKEFEAHQKLEGMDEEHKKEFQDKLEEEKKAKKHHEPLHHPGSKQQYQEVWEKQDHMEQQQFDPKVFFMMHDIDGNGVWDADEVKALFIKELDKMYGPGGPNKDLHERAEEMERMREHVFKESDTNHDGLIDFQEFIHQTKRSEFQQDQGWKPINENEIYSQSEYQEFERRRLEELRYLQQRGLVDAHGNPIPGAHHQIRQALHQRQQAYMQQMPQQYHGQPPPQYQQAQQGQMQQGQGQIPLGHQGQGQMPLGYQGQGQIQIPQAAEQAQIPLGQYPGQQQGYQQPQVQGQGQMSGQNLPPVQQQNAPNQVPQSQGAMQGQVGQGQAQPQVIGSQGQAPPQGQIGQGQASPQGQVVQGQAQLQGIGGQGQASSQH